MLRVLRYLGCALLAALVITAASGLAQHGVKDGEWRSYAGDNGSSRYAPYDLLTRDNVKDLQVVWSWKFDNFGGGNSETTPIMANGVLYFTVGAAKCDCRQPGHW
jgi:glucose dehydrogenase